MVWHEIMGNISKTISLHRSFKLGFYWAVWTRNHGLFERKIIIWMPLSLDMYGVMGTFILVCVVSLRLIPVRPLTCLVAIFPCQKRAINIIPHSRHDQLLNRYRPFRMSKFPLQTPRSHWTSHLGTLIWALLTPLMYVCTLDLNNFSYSELQVQTERQYLCINSHCVKTIQMMRNQ